VNALNIEVAQSITCEQERRLGTACCQSLTAPQPQSFALSCCAYGTMLGCCGRLDGPHDWIRALFIKGKMLSGSAAEIVDVL